MPGKGTSQSRAAIPAIASDSDTAAKTQSPAPHPGPPKTERGALHCHGKTTLPGREARPAPCEERAKGCWGCPIRSRAHRGPKFRACTRLAAALSSSPGDLPAGLRPRGAEQDTSRGWAIVSPQGSSGSRGEVPGQEDKGGGGVAVPSGARRRPLLPTPGRTPADGRSSARLPGKRQAAPQHSPARIALPGYSPTTVTSPARCKSALMESSGLCTFMLFFPISKFEESASRWNLIQYMGQLTGLEPVSEMDCITARRNGLFTHHSSHPAGHSSLFLCSQVCSAVTVQG
ncbi:translation initiation factor IF-2 isoform X2 [Chelonia mydas]|uniref:translation initiation factor IF-2 isoform X2 n=1 Tax=Chelonia mydas TaxID=8469 RepID=UPI0018A22238|nr:translation initiation factor IF-2 isoform X2 [Chelonia mydas]